MGISKLNPSAGGIPFGDTAGRPTAATGKLYSNGETARLELYTSNGSWENIVQEVPGVSSIGGQYLETNNSNTITIYGTNFVSGASAYAVGTNAVEVAATSTTFASLVELSAVFTGLTAANEPYDIKVVNPSNLFGILSDCLFVNNQVTWTTSAGSLGSFGDAVAISVSAIAADESAITYAVASGSSLPSGITLNTATGLISGTLPDVASNTTYTFTLTASDGSNPAVSRQFSFTSNAAPIWSTESGSLGTFNENTSISLTVAATDVSDSITYALASGSSLPSGITLNSASGVISGTLPDVASDTTYTFTINALDGVNTIPRTFSINSQTAFSVEYLVIAGGGSGGIGRAGGGGAGGYRTGTLSGFISSTNYSAAVGLGGTGSTNNAGNNGANSIFSTITSTGGGGGANGGVGRAGNSGGSGGGAAAEDGLTASGGAGNTPSTSPSQGNNGGNSNGGGGYSGAGGGGGGAGSAGQNAPGTTTAGNGGAGAESSITGTSVIRAGGGGGGTMFGGSSSSSGTPGSGGSGGGGAGGTGPGQSNGTNGSANTGSGGGAGGQGGAGGSGIVILRYPNTRTITIGAGLTGSTATDGSFKVTSLTAGSGNVSWA